MEYVFIMTTFLFMTGYEGQPVPKQITITMSQEDIDNILYPKSISQELRDKYPTVEVLDDWITSYNVDLVPDSDNDVPSAWLD